MNDISSRLEFLTRRERQVAYHAATGLSDLNIAAALGISENTVGTHMMHIFHKLRICARAELLAHHAELGRIHE